MKSRTVQPIRRQSKKSGRNKNRKSSHNFGDTQPMRPIRGRTASGPVRYTAYASHRNTGRLQRISKSDRPEKRSAESAEAGAG